jgi:penicillin amidase
MAKDFGPAHVESDRMARAVLFRGSLYREWLAYASDAKRIAEAFAAGVNAWVELTERQPELLPEEFRLLGYRPSRWNAADIVRIRHHGLTLNLTGEIDRAEVYCKDGREAPRVDWMRRALVPETTPALPAGLDPCALPFERLREAYALATARPRFEDSLAQGSNNWVVAPARTATGRPVLASDPHRTHGTPSLRYISHLVAPGLDVIGAGEPFLLASRSGTTRRLRSGSPGSTWTRRISTSTRPIPSGRTSTATRTAGSRWRRSASGSRCAARRRAR